MNCCCWFWQEADTDLFQKTGFLDDSFETREQAFPSAQFPPPPGKASQQEESEQDEPVLQVQPQSKGKTLSLEEKAASNDPLLDPLLDCIPVMPKTDAAMAEFLGLESPSLDSPVLQVSNAV